MIKSLLTEKNPFNSSEELREWIRKRNREVEVDVKLIPFDEMDGWYVDENGSLRHTLGSFFPLKVFI